MKGVVRVSTKRTRRAAPGLPLLLVGGLTLALVLGGCGSSSEGPRVGSASPTVLAAVGGPRVEALEVFRDEDLRDVTTLADHLVEVTITGQEEERPAPGQDLERDLGGLTMLAFDVRVDRVLWSRPGVPTAPKSFRYVMPGYFQPEGGKRERVSPGGVGILQVGESYVVPIVDASSFAPPNAIDHWGALTMGSWLRETDAAVSRPEQASVGAGWTHTILGQTPEQLAKTLADTGPWAGVDASLPVLERQLQVQDRVAEIRGYRTEGTSDPDVS